MPKRGKRKSSQLPSGNYRTRVCIGKDKNGVRKFKSFVAPSKAEADYLAHEYLIANGRAETGKEMALRDAYTSYIAAKSKVLSPSTVREYSFAAKRDFPELMPLRLSELTQERVQVAVNTFAANHSPKSVRNAHGLLSAVLHMYRPELQLSTRLPQRSRPDIYVPSKDEIRALLDYIKGTEMEKAVMLSAFGSLRRSEICALTAEDIDRKTNIITINKALVKNKDKQWSIKLPKTKAGFREVTMPKFVIDRLPEEGSVVKILPTTITHEFARYLRRAGMPHFRFHDLRHYQASILTAMGVPDSYIIERCGWETDSTLKNIYQHTMTDKRKKIEADICKAFEDENE